MLSDEFSHGLERVGLMGGLEMVDIPSSGQGAQIGLRITKVFQHVVPGAFSKETTIPQMQIVLKDGLFSKNDVSKINHLLCRHKGIGMFSKLNKIFNGIEDSVNRLRDVVMHIVEFYFLPLNLLLSNFAVSGEKMEDHSANAGGVLAGGAVEQCSNVNRVNRLNNLGNKSFLCSLTELERLLEFAPNIFGGFNLRASAACGGTNGLGFT